MIGYYSTKRKTNRWPNVVFSNMLDISALNAFIIFSEIDVSWAPGDLNRRRPEFLRQLALSLANEYMIKRSKIPQQPFSAELLAEIRTSSLVTIASSSSSAKNSPARKRGICSCCNTKSDHKCVICGKFICKPNRKTICLTCNDSNFQKNK